MSVTKVTYIQISYLLKVGIDCSVAELQMIGIVGKLLLQ